MLQTGDVIATSEETTPNHFVYQDALDTCLDQLAGSRILLSLSLYFSGFLILKGCLYGSGLAWVGPLSRVLAISVISSNYEGINFIHNHPPGHDLKGAKTLPPGQSLCTKTLPSGQNRESKAPPPGHKVRKFHKYSFKL